MMEAKNTGQGRGDAHSAECTPPQWRLGRHHSLEALDDNAEADDGAENGETGGGCIRDVTGNGGANGLHINRRSNLCMSSHRRGSENSKDGDEFGFLIHLIAYWFVCLVAGEAKFPDLPSGKSQQLRMLIMGAALLALEGKELPPFNLPLNGILPQPEDTSPWNAGQLRSDHKEKAGKEAVCKPLG